MAHAIRLSELTDELIESITNHTPGSPAFKACKDAATKSLRYHRYGRTNQYAVKSSLNGLVEKFQVLGNDPLAEELGDRLVKFEQKKYQWAPEALSLLLSLSDRPHEKAKVEDARPIVELEPAPQLTWDEIIADDPLEPDGLWDDIDYKGGSSDEESTLDSLPPSEATQNTTISVPYDLNAYPKTESLLVEPDAAALDEIRRAQAWIQKTGQDGKSSRRLLNTHLISELQAIRDVLHMLSGLPSTLFNSEGGQVTNRKQHRIGNVSLIVLDDVLQSFANTGTNLNKLRKWCSKLQSLPLLQTFQSSANKSIQDFNAFIAQLQTVLVTPSRSTVVSIITIHNTVRSTARFIELLWDLVDQVQDELQNLPFHVLDVLFQKTCNSQIAGDDSAFRHFANLFFECLKTYLKPIRRWMQGGELDFQDEHFPILLRNEGADPSNFWSDRYAFRRHGDRFCAPTFLHASMAEVLASGKTVAFLKELGLEEELIKASTVDEPPLSFNTIFSNTDEASLAPFSYLFQKHLDDWIRSKHHQFACILKQRLLDDFCLQRTTDALATVFLSANGALFDSFSRAVFRRLDSGKPNWNRRYVVEDLAQTIFGEAISVNARALTAVRLISNPSASASERTVRALSTISLSYTYPWPVKNIIPSNFLKTYQDLFKLILQLRRAKYVLINPRLVASTAGSPTRSKALASSLSLPLTLRHRLLHLVTTTESHILHHAAARSASELQAATNAAPGIDALVIAHQRFVHHLQARALLVPAVANVRKALLSCLDLAVLFADTWRGGVGSQVGGMREQLASSSGLEESTGSEVLVQAHGTTESADEKQAKYRKMRGQLSQLTAFVIAGLRAAGRSEGGEEGWEMLAERLEWGTTGHDGA